MASNIIVGLKANGFVALREHLPDISGFHAFSELGTIVKLPGVPEVLVLAPHHAVAASPNTYSGNFGTNEFPLHSDLAHWFLPPRYLALRCVVGTQQVATRVVDSKKLVATFGDARLRRTLVGPRRPIQRTRPLLRLLRNLDDGSTLFRWDSLFVVPSTGASTVICEAVADYLDSTEPEEVVLSQPGDTLIIDNWRMLHGRSPVSPSEEHRQIERAYFGVMY